MDFNFESNFLNSHFADINGILCQIFWNIDLLQGSPFAVYSKTILPILPKICSKNCKGTFYWKIILIGGMEDNSKVQQVQQVLSLTNLETAKNQNRSKKLEIRKICFKILLFLDTWNIEILKYCDFKAACIWRSGRIQFKAWMFPVGSGLVLTNDQGHYCQTNVESSFG